MKVWLTTDKIGFTRATLCWRDMAGCLSVCLSVTSQYRVETDGRLFAWRLPSTYPILCCKEIRVSTKITLNKGITIWNFVPNSSENFAAARQSSQHVVNLAGEEWTLSVTNRSVVGRTSWRYLQRSRWPDEFDRAVYHSAVYSKRQEAAYRTGPPAIAIIRSVSVLYPYFPENRYQLYYLRQHPHNKALIKQRNETIRWILYKNCYYLNCSAYLINYVLQ